MDQKPIHVGIIGSFGDVPDRRVRSDSEDRKSICLRQGSSGNLYSVTLPNDTASPRYWEFREIRCWNPMRELNED